MAGAVGASEPEVFKELSEQQRGQQGAQYDQKTPTPFEALWLWQRPAVGAGKLGNAHRPLKSFVHHREDRDDNSMWFGGTTP
jgi:hypothetical protein